MKTFIKMQFDPEIAKNIGVEEALMYSNIEYWCEKNKANNKNYFNNYYWTYNCTKAFIILFPFWTEKQIRRIIKNLEEGEYIKSGNFNKSKYDKTKWYTTFCKNDDIDKINQEIKPIKNIDELLPNKEFDLSKWANETFQMGRPIPNNKPNNKHKGIDHPSKTIKKDIAKEKRTERLTIPPTLELVTQYCLTRNNGVDPKKFIDRNTATNWMYGKTKIKDWQAVVRMWERNQKEWNKDKPIVNPLEQEAIDSVKQCEMQYGMQDGAEIAMSRFSTKYGIQEMMKYKGIFKL
jgi:hypothetical protein